MFSKVIVGVDGRDGGRDAIALATRLAPRAELVLAHAYPYGDDLLHTGGGTSRERLRSEAEERLRAARRGSGISARIATIADTSAARGLHRLADRLGADLIVTGSSRSGLAEQVLPGDVARSVLTHAPCAVAVAPVGYELRAGDLAGGVGVGFDGSPESAQALHVAAEIARALSTRLRVLCAVRPPGPASAEAAPDYDWAALGERAYQGADERLARALSELDVPAEAIVTAGSAAEHLERLSTEVSLLILGARRSGPVRRILLGSTADHLACTAACPILVTPRPAAPPAEASALTGRVGRSDPR